MRGCCLGLVVLVVLAAGGAVLLWRAISAPDLGAAPAGPDHGENETAIAVTLAAQVVPQLLAGPHATVTLSEHDLTVIISENNPQPGRFHDPQARVRGGELLVSGQTSVAIFRTTTTAHVVITLDASKQVRADVASLDVGSIGVPGWLQGLVVPQAARSVSLQSFVDSPQMAPLRQQLDCVGVTSAGLVIGFHRPGAADSPNACR